VPVGSTAGVYGAAPAWASGAAAVPAASAAGTGASAGAAPAAAGSGGAAPAASSGSLFGNMTSSDLLRYGSMALGAFGGASGSGAQSASTTTSLPPHLAALGPGFAARAAEAGNLPNPGVEPFNADQLAGFQAVRDQAAGPLTGDATGLLSRTMRGDYLQGNPYLDRMVAQTTDDLQGRFNTTAMGSGSFGNANATQAGMRGIADAANTLRYTNYSNERDRQMQAAGLAPAINQMGLLNANALLGVGDQQQQFGDRVRQNDMDWRMRQLDALGKPFGYNMGSTTTQTQPGTNRLAGALGGALTAAQLWKLFGG
jgi:hypothetical protein